MIHTIKIDNDEYALKFASIERMHLSHVEDSLLIVFDSGETQWFYEHTKLIYNIILDWYRDNDAVSRIEFTEEGFTITNAQYEKEQNRSYGQIQTLVGLPKRDESLHTYQVLSVNCIDTIEASSQEEAEEKASQLYRGDLLVEFLPKS